RSTMERSRGAGDLRGAGGAAHSEPLVGAGFAGPSRIRRVTSLFHPLTEAQEGLWYAQRLDPDNPIYNTGVVLDLRGSLDIEAFRYAVDAASAQADALAVRMIETEEGPVQRVEESFRARLRVVDLRGEAHPSAAAEAWIEADMSRPLNLGEDP